MCNKVLYCEHHEDSPKDSTTLLHFISQFMNFAVSGKKYRTSEEKTGTSSYFCKNVYNRYVKQQTSLVSAYAIMG